MIQSFKYKNSKGEIKERLVAVLSETPDYLLGLEINNILNPIEDSKVKEETKKRIYSMFENRKVTFYTDLKSSRLSEKTVIEGFDNSWMKAFRNFKKVNIIQDR